MIIENAEYKLCYQITSFLFAKPIPCDYEHIAKITEFRMGLE